MTDCRASWITRCIEIGSAGLPGDADGLWQPAQTFEGGGLSFQVSHFVMAHQAIQMPGQRLILAEIWCAAEHGTLYSLTFHGTDRKRAVWNVGSTEKKNKLPWRCSCLCRQKTKEHMWSYESLIFLVKAFVSVRCQLMRLFINNTHPLFPLPGPCLRQCQNCTSSFS